MADERKPEELAEAVRDSEVRVVVGERDDLLRDLRLRVDVEVPEDLRRTLGFDGADPAIDATLRDPNGRQPAPPRDCG